MQFALFVCLRLRSLVVRSSNIAGCLLRHFAFSDNRVSICMHFARTDNCDFICMQFACTEYCGFICMHFARTRILHLSMYARLRLGQLNLHLGGVPPFPNCLCSCLLIHLCDAFYGVFG